VGRAAAVFMGLGFIDGPLDSPRTLGSGERG